MNRRITKFFNWIAAVSLAAAVFAPCPVLGQGTTHSKAVTGDKYKKTGTPKKVPYTVESVVLQNATEVGTFHGKPADIFDQDNNTWWKANKKGTVIFEITLEKEATFNFLHFWVSGNPDERPKSIRFEARDENREWSTVQKWSGDACATETQSLPLPLNSLLTTRYLRFTFEAKEGSLPFALNEIWLKEQKEVLAKIIHKKARYYAKRENRMDTIQADTFDDKHPFFELKGDDKIQEPDPIQAAHTYADTIYMHRGENIVLTLPDYLPSLHPEDKKLNAMKTYQRWYSFRTGKTFRTNNTKDNEVIDLLTPVSKLTTPYRFENGYVGVPFTSETAEDIDTYPAKMQFYFPKVEEFNEWFDVSENWDGKWFAVACDVSSYADYNKNNYEGGGVFVEPTLSHRIIYYIRAIDEGDEVPAEEYEINFPATRLPSFTPEAVSLSKDARAYALPGIQQDPEDIELTVTITDNNAGIRLKSQEPVSGKNYFNYLEVIGNTVTLKGEKRTIFFDYPNENEDGTRSVEGKTATIEVRRRNNNNRIIARFKLNFLEETRLLTQSMVEELDEKRVQGNPTWNELAYRTPKYLHDRYQLVTALDFDYQLPVENPDKHTYYPFPVSWNYSSYAFYDGTTDKKEFQGNRSSPEWGWYGLTNYYLECTGGGWNQHRPKPEPLINRKGKHSSYHMYIDASDRPGVVARLPFRQNLCEGAELFITAWVKSALFGNQSDNAAMLLTVMGVDGDGKYHPLYRCQTGQIPATYKLNANSKLPNLPGFKEGDRNEWFQIYFSFVNKNPIKFERYELHIDNNSGSTQGGDMYIDDIRVYMDNMSADVRQKKVMCVDETLMNLRLDWNRLLSCFGDKADEGNGDLMKGVDFCIIDKLLYEEKLTECKGDWVEAVEQSLQYTKGNKNPRKFSTLYYWLKYDENKEYIVSQNPEDACIPEEIRENTGKFGFYSYSSGNVKELRADFYATLKPNREYMILIKEHSTAITDTTEMIVAYGKPGDPCTRFSEFRVQPGHEILINGEPVSMDDALDNFCIGQTFKVGMKLYYFDKDNHDYKVYEGDVFYDWFFGKMDEFTAEDEVLGCSLQEALGFYRDQYPDGEAIDGELEGNPTGGFTEKHKKLIEKYLKKEVGERKRHLELHKEELDVRLLDDGVLDLVVYPNPVETEDDTWNYLICSNPKAVQLKAGGKNVKVHPGFEYMLYPDLEDKKTYDPAMRLGLKQIKASSEENPIYVNLRNAKFAFKTKVDDPGKPENYEPDHLGLMGDDVSPTQRDLYLLGSTDPDLKEIFEDPTYDRHRYSIGKVTKFWAKPYDKNTYQGGNDSYMEIYFTDVEDFSNLKKEGKLFVLREGYEYTFGVHYEEKDKDGKQASGSCYNNMEITMKVVPEYLVWQGKDATHNWNNDKNWRRATNEQLKKTDDSYTDDDKASGYVPMKFSYVVMPRDSKVELYPAGFEGNETKYQNLQWEGTQPEGMELPSTDQTKGYPIQYDMVVHSEEWMQDVIDWDQNNKMKTRPYSVNHSREIHFEPHTEMAHAELLDYQKAWIDYQLTPGRWYALTSSLKGVVSGDFYTDKTGTEGSEYFKGIKWNGTDNSRFSPTVYQRGWEGQHNMIGVENGHRAISGKWSAVYNDAAKPYTPLSGFSLKVQDLTNSDNAAIFRLPKADLSYSYYSTDNGSSNATKEINREGAGRLRIDDLKEENAIIEVELQANGDHEYYLVGNPFMSHLDMNAFMASNNNVGGYWVLNDDNQEVGVGGDNGLVTNGSGTIAPLQSFFVKLKETVVEKKVKFTVGMQVLAPAVSGNTQRSSESLTIIATTLDGRQSRAAIAYDGMASDNYQAGEDAELFLDANLGDRPMVYTVAGTMATSVNRISGLQDIPVGIYGNRSERVTLSFGGLRNFSTVTLFDAQQQTETLLREGESVDVPAHTSGRYFLRLGTPTGNEVIARQAFQIYSLGGGRVMVSSSNTPLKTIRVHALSGAQVCHLQAGGMQQEIHLQHGIYLITVMDQEGLQETRKVQVQ